MFYKTNGVILNTIKYNDKSSIVNILTEQFGIIAYNIPNSRSKKSSVKRNIFQPLNIVEMEVEHKPNRDIQRIKEVRISIPLNSIYSNPIKSSIAILLSEIIERFVTKSIPNISLFSFVENSIEIIDLKDNGFGNFHLIFIFKLIKFMGIEPNFEEWKSGYWLDIEHGVIEGTKPKSSLYLEQYDTELLYKISRLDYTSMNLLPLNRNDRNIVLDALINYLRFHVNPKIELKSPEIIKSLFD